MPTSRAISRFHFVVFVFYCLQISRCEYTGLVEVGSHETTVLLNGEEFCRPGFSPVSMVKTEAWRLDAKYDFLLARHDGAPCVSGKGLCISNESPLFSTKTGNEHSYTCLCNGGFYRHLQTSFCVPCSLGMVCPHLSDNFYLCPQGSVPAPMRPSAVFDDSVSFCIPAHGIRLTRPPSAHKYRIFDAIGSDLYNAAVSSLCPPMQVKGLDGRCQCSAGYYMIAAECKPCPAASFCQNNIATPCPAGKTSASLSADVSDCSIPTCEPGFWRVLDKCLPCHRGFFCSNGAMHKCPNDSTTPFMYATDVESCVCSEGLLKTTHAGAHGGFVCVHNSSVFVRAEIDSAITAVSPVSDFRILWPTGTFHGGVLVFDDLNAELALFLKNEHGVVETTRTKLDELISADTRQSCKLHDAVQIKGDIFSLISCAYGSVDGVVSFSVSIDQTGRVAMQKVREFKASVSTDETISYVASVPALVVAQTQRVFSSNLHNFSAPSIVLNVTQELTALGYIVGDVPLNLPMEKHASSPFLKTNYSVSCHPAYGSEAFNVVQGAEFVSPAFQIFEDQGVVCLEVAVEPSVKTIQVGPNTTVVDIPRDQNVSISWLGTEALIFEQVAGMTQTFFGVDFAVSACNNFGGIAENNMELARSFIGSEGANVSQLQDIFNAAGVLNATSGTVMSAESVFASWDKDADGRLSSVELAQAQNISVASFLVQCVLQATLLNRVAQTVVDASKVDNTTLKATGSVYENITFRLVNGSDSARVMTCFNAIDCSLADVPVQKESKPAPVRDPLSIWVMGNGTVVSGKYVRRPCFNNSQAGPDRLSCVCLPGFKKAPDFASCVACSARERCSGNGSVEICDISSSDVDTQRCSCLDGTFLKDGACTDYCPAHHICHRGVVLACPENMTSHSNPERGCVCQPGLTLSVHTFACEPCQRGYWCSNAEVHACPAQQTSEPGTAQESACECLPGFTKDPSGKCNPCVRGTYMPIGAAYCEACGENMTTLREGSAGSDSCICQDGFEFIRGRCLLCTDSSSICRDGARRACPKHHVALPDHTDCVCSPGRVRVAQGDACELCRGGAYCDESQGWKSRPCPGSMTSDPGSSDESDCFCGSSAEVKIFNGLFYECICAEGYQALSGACTACPENSASMLLLPGIAESDSSCMCEPGFYAAVEANGQPRCSICEAGYYCPGTRFEQGRLPCPTGHYSQLQGAHTTTWCLPCKIQTGIAPAAGGSLPACSDFFMPLKIESNSSYDFADNSKLASFQVSAQALAITKSTLQEVEERLREILGANAVPDFLGFREVDSTETLKWSLSSSMLSALSLAVVKHSSGNVYTSVRTSLEAAPHSAVVIFSIAFCMIMQAVTSWLTTAQGYCVLFRMVSTETQSLAQAAASAILRDLAPDASTGTIVFSIDQNTEHLVGILQSSSLVGNSVAFASVADELEIIGLGENMVAVSPTSDVGKAVLRNIDSNNQRNYPRLRFSTTEAISTNMDEDACSQVFPFVHECSAMVGNGGSLCEFCAAGTEFRNRTSGLCQPCRSFSDHGCASVQPCCGYDDTQCLSAESTAQSLRDLSLCGNGVIDIIAGEQCDWKQTGLNCCDNSCKLLPGYYAFPWCSTVCGDQIVAGSEECDSYLDEMCSPETCKCYAATRIDSSGMCSELVDFF